MMDYVFRKLAEKAVDTAVDMAADAIKSKRCTKCGQAMGHDARFCPHCGWDQQVTPPRQGGPADPPPAQRAGPAKPPLQHNTPPLPERTVVATPPRPALPATPAPSAPFNMRIEAVYSIKGRTVVAGPVTRGAIRAGERAEVVGGGQKHATVALSVESVSATLGSERPGDNVAICLQDLRSEDVRVGMQLAAPGTVDASSPIVVRATVAPRPATAVRPASAGTMPAPGQPPRVLAGHRAEVTAVALSHDGTVGVSADREGAVHVWDCASGALRGTLRASDPGAGALWLACIELTPDGRQVLAGAASPPYPVLAWDMSSGLVTRRLTGHNDMVNAIRCLPGGKQVLSCSEDRTMRLWELASGHELQRFEHPNEVSGIDVSPDGRQALSLCGDAMLRLWELASGNLLAQISLGSDYASPLSQKVAFAPDGTRAATCNLVGDVDVWQLPGGQRAAVLQAGGNAFAVAFHPDGKRVVAASGSDYAGPEESANNVYIWDSASGAELAVLRGHTGNVNSVALSPDGRFILSGSSDKTVRLWTL